MIGYTCSVNCLLTSHYNGLCAWLAWVMPVCGLRSYRLCVTCVCSVCAVQVYVLRVRDVCVIYMRTTCLCV